MKKIHVTLQIDGPLDLRLRLYAAHLGQTKAAAAALALEAGIPGWVTPPAQPPKGIEQSAPTGGKRAKKDTQGPGSRGRAS